VPTFVDAYNVIHAAMNRRMAGFEIISGETDPSRQALLGLLAKYRTVRSDKITVFFDGGVGAAHLPRHAIQTGIDIRFSDAGSDADTEIKHAVSQADSPTNIRVVTSDMAIVRFVKRFGAKVIDSSDFLRQVLDALQDSALPTDEPIEKYEGTASDAETEYWLGVFGDEDEDDIDNL
jgi:predicted RNA-binding protein with PIN domain